MNYKNLPSINISVAGTIGFSCTLILNLLVQFNFPSYENMIFTPQWMRSIWLPLYLLSLAVLLVGISLFVFGKSREIGAIDKKTNYSRLAIAVLLFLFGAFPFFGSIFDPGWDRIDAFVFGLVYIFSAYLIFIPLYNKKSLPTGMATKYLICIAAGSCLVVLILPAVYYLVPFKPARTDSLIFSSYENGYIYGLFAVAFAIGLNLRLERGAGHKIIFLVLGISTAIVLISIAYLTIYVISSLA